MIGRITGVLIEKLPPTVCVDVNGVGYDIDVPMSTLYDLPDLGQKISLYTHLAVREDAHLLFGFLRASEREAFRTLVKVSGIGARTALSVLSGMSVDELAQSIAEQDTARIMKVPGIGKKTAERLILELKDKFANVSIQNHNSQPSNRNDILNALAALGYNEKEAKAAMQSLPATIDVSDGIRMALKNLSK